jgi:hypothetical protein
MADIDIEKTVDALVAKARAKGPTEGKPSYAYKATNKVTGRNGKYFILWGKWQAIAEERGMSGLLMAPYELSNFDESDPDHKIVYTLSEHPQDMDYVTPVTEDMGATEWERISIRDTPEHITMPQVEWDAMHGITPEDRRDMEARHLLFEGMEALVKNRGKIHLKHPWATTEPYCSELEDEPSFKFEIKANGHTVWFDRFEPMSFSYHLYSQVNTGKIAQAWLSDTPLTEMVPLKFGEYSSEGCTYCGTHEFLTDGFTITAAEPCPYPEGMECEIILDVPSGVVVIGNDFRDKFPGATDQEGYDFYVNTSRGIYGTIKDHEADKMAHFFVGNSCPTVYRTAQDTLLIANGPSEELEVEKEDGGYDYVDNPELGKWLADKLDIGGVCTDLWWVSMVDQAEAESRGMDTAKENGPGWTEYVHYECDPGRYKITYNGLKKSFDRDAYPTIYAVMERIGDVPDPS